MSHLLSTPPKIWLVGSFALCLITSWITGLQVEISLFCVSRVYQTKVFLQMPGGELLGILGGGVQPGSSNPDPLWPLQTKKCNFPQPFSHQTSKNPYPFSDLTFRQKLFHHYLVGRKQKILQILLKFAYFFLLSLSLLIFHDKYVQTLP